MGRKNYKPVIQELSSGWQKAAFEEHNGENFKDDLMVNFSKVIQKGFLSDIQDVKNPQQKAQALHSNFGCQQQQD